MPPRMKSLAEQNLMALRYAGYAKSQEVAYGPGVAHLFFSTAHQRALRDIYHDLSEAWEVLADEIDQLEDRMDSIKDKELK